MMFGLNFTHSLHAMFLHDMQRPSVSSSQVLISPTPIRDDREIHALNRSNQGLPEHFVSYRRDTVEKFLLMLYPEKGAPTNFVFIRSPPFSGKTTLSQLIVSQARNHLDAEDNIVLLNASALGPNETVAQLFQRTYEREFKTVIPGRFSKARTLLVFDEGQCTYADPIWRELFKPLLDGQYPNLRVVVLSSYGSFDPYRNTTRNSTPFLIPHECTFGLRTAPGLLATSAEFEEILKYDGRTNENEWYLEVSKHYIWCLSQGNIGVISFIVQYLRRRFGNLQLHTIKAPHHVIDALRTREFNDSFKKEGRGVPSVGAFNTVMKEYEVPEEARQKAESLLNQVSRNGYVASSETTRTPGSEKALQLLVKHGFLFEDVDGMLKFASALHDRIWVYSTRTDSLPHLKTQSRFNDFICAAISRMSSTQLYSFRKANEDVKVREKQFQMELYRAIVSCVQRSSSVVPEWTAGTGWVDIYVDIEDGWLLELLVDGADAEQHRRRFESGGRYFDSLKPETRIALLDFRETRDVRVPHEGTIYVSFKDNYRCANVNGVGITLCE